VAQARALLPGFEARLHKRETPVQAAQLDGGELGAMLAAWPFRLPTEAEWEYAARAGTTTLTYRGDLVPDERDLIDEYADEAATARDENRFGLSGIGSCSELCADVYVDGYADAPVDGSARTGAGPRVQRGGSVNVSPWQGCGEWLAMLSASRYAIEFDHSAVRPALSI
jgi:formylglycine-generating enzyme required for sulfatase activity